MLKQPSWSDDLLEKLFAHVRIHCTKRVIQEIDVPVTVDRPSQADTLLLSTTEGNALRVVQIIMESCTYPVRATSRSHVLHVRKQGS